MSGRTRAETDRRREVKGSEMKEEESPNTPLITFMSRMPHKFSFILHDHQSQSLHTVIFVPHSSTTPSNLINPNNLNMA